MCKLVICQARLVFVWKLMTLHLREDSLRKRFCMLAAVLSLAMFAATAQSNLLDDGSFELATDGNMDSDPTTFSLSLTGVTAGEDQVRASTDTRHVGCRLCCGWPIRQGSLHGRKSDHTGDRIWIPADGQRVTTTTETLPSTPTVLRR